MMVRVAPPAPGWYPDPEGGTRLRWWHGTDWSDRYRPPPSSSELQRAAATRATAEPSPPIGPASGTRRSLTRSEADEIIAQVRQVARAEVDRAAEKVTQQARSAAREIQPLISEYTNRLLRWLRIALLIAVVAVIAWFVFEAVAQATFLEWLGDRIDSLTD
jgi:hypothetical protein